jgi:hypothetical protein
MHSRWLTIHTLSTPITLRIHDSDCQRRICQVIADISADFETLLAATTMFGLLPGPTLDLDKNLPWRCHDRGRD